MQSVPISQLKNHLSKFISMVMAREEFSITRRGVEVARLIPSAEPPKINRAELIIAARARFGDVPAFDERELTRAGRKW